MRRRLESTVNVPTCLPTEGTLAIRFEGGEGRDEIGQNESGLPTETMGGVLTADSPLVEPHPWFQQGFFFFAGGDLSMSCIFGVIARAEGRSPALLSRVAVSYLPIWTWPGSDREQGGPFNIVSGVALCSCPTDGRHAPNE